MSKVIDLFFWRAVEQANAGYVRTQMGSSPLVFDSPHSGTAYPDDFDHVRDLAELRRAEDTHVEKLFDFAGDLDISWIEALFPRSYLDANRSDEDIDIDMIEGEWSGRINTDPAAISKLRLGKGLIWKLTDEGEPLYARKLDAEEVRSRIDRCWRPYHEVVAKAIESAHDRHGYSIHINCHSMPSVAASHATDFPGLVHTDFVVGDRDGSTASPQITNAIVKFLRDRGYSVSLNHPYKGVELVRRHSNPAEGRHSVQLEINRKLYMNEETLELHEGAEKLKKDLRVLSEMLLTLKVSTPAGNQLRN